MRLVKLFADITAFLIAVSASAFIASADEVTVQNDSLYERSVASEQTEDNTDSIEKETSGSEDEGCADQYIFPAAITAAAEPNTRSEENESSSAGAPAGIAVALGAVACTIVGVSKRK